MPGGGCFIEDANDKVLKTTRVHCGTHSMLLSHSLKTVIEQLLMILSTIRPVEPSDDVISVNMSLIRFKHCQNTE